MDYRQAGRQRKRVLLFARTELEAAAAAAAAAADGCRRASTWPKEPAATRIGPARLPGRRAGACWAGARRTGACCRAGAPLLPRVSYLKYGTHGLLIDELLIRNTKAAEPVRRCSPVLHT